MAKRKKTSKLTPRDRERTFLVAIAAMFDNLDEANRNRVMCTLSAMIGNMSAAKLFAEASEEAARDNIADRLAGVEVSCRCSTLGGER